MTSKISNSRLNQPIQPILSSQKAHNVRFKRCRRITPEMVKSQATSDQVSIIRHDINDRIIELREDKGPKQLLAIQDTIKSVKAACETMQSIGLNFKSELSQLNALEKQLTTTPYKHDATITTSSSTSPAQISTAPKANPFPTATVPIEKPTPLPVKSLLAPVPKDGIKVGLPNTGNTCWLNALLVFISCTPFYDKMMSDPPPKGREKLQETLRNIVNDLRRGIFISNKTYYQFLKEVKEQILILVPERDIRLGDTADAPELFRKLIEALNWAPLRERLNPKEIQELIESGLYAQKGKIYRSKIQGVEKYGFIGNSEPHIEIDLNKYRGTKDEIDLENGTEEREIRPDAAPKMLGTGNQKFEFQEVYTHLPTTLMLFLKRTSSESNSYIQCLKILNPLKLHKGHIIITEYAPIMDDLGRIIDMKPAYRCRYRIGASITHNGGPGGGHFICEERTATGTLYHDDRTVSELNDPNMGVNGYLVRLDLVDKTKIEP